MALGQGADVALVNMVSGDVAYQPKTGTLGKVEPLYDEMKTVVAEMQRKQPDNQDVKAPDAWLISRTSR